MDNSYQPPSLTPYVTSLTMEDLPAISHVTSTSVRSHSVSRDSFKSPVGYLKIVDGYKVAVHTKPSSKHLHNMKKTFGWTWENV